MASWRWSLALSAIFLLLANVAAEFESCGEVGDELSLCGTVRKGIVASNAGKQSLLGSSSGDVLYKFTITGDKRPIYFGTCFPQTDLDTVLRLYDVCPVRETLPDYIAANDDAHKGCPYNPYASELTVELSAGTYYLLVEGSFFREGNFMLQILDPHCNEGASPLVEANRVHPAPAELAPGVVEEIARPDGFDWNVPFNPNKFVDDAVTALPVPTATALPEPVCSSAILLDDPCITDGILSVSGSTSGLPSYFGNGSPDSLYLLNITEKTQTAIFDTCSPSTEFSSTISIYSYPCPSSAALPLTVETVACAPSGSISAVKITAVLPVGAYYVVVGGLTATDQGGYVLAINVTTCSSSASDVCEESGLLPPDECGVCGGDDKSCAGCNGVPNSGLVLDTCCECGGDNSTCAPSVTSMSPDSGAVCGGEELVVYGANFEKSESVFCIFASGSVAKWTFAESSADGTSLSCLTAGWDDVESSLASFTVDVSLYAESVCTQDDTTLESTRFVFPELAVGVFTFEAVPIVSAVDPREVGSNGRDVTLTVTQVSTRSPVYVRLCPCLGDSQNCNLGADETQCFTIEPSVVATTTTTVVVGIPPASTTGFTTSQVLQATLSYNGVVFYWSDPAVNIMYYPQPVEVTTVTPKYGPLAGGAYYLYGTNVRANRDTYCRLGSVVSVGNARPVSQTEMALSDGGSLGRRRLLGVDTFSTLVPNAITYSESDPDSVGILCQAGPVDSTQTVEVAVSFNGGFDWYVAVDSYTYVDPWVVDKVTPSTGSITGGYDIVIKGKIKFPAPKELVVVRFGDKINLTNSDLKWDSTGKLLTITVPRYNTTRFSSFSVQCDIIFSGVYVLSSFNFTYFNDVSAKSLDPSLLPIGPGATVSIKTTGLISDLNTYTRLSSATCGLFNTATGLFLKTKSAVVEGSLQYTTTTAWTATLECDLGDITGLVSASTCGACSPYWIRVAPNGYNYSPISASVPVSTYVAPTISVVRSRGRILVTLNVIVPVTSSLKCIAGSTISAPMYTIQYPTYLQVSCPNSAASTAGITINGQDSYTGPVGAGARRRLLDDASAAVVEISSDVITAGSTLTFNNSLAESVTVTLTKAATTSSTAKTVSVTIPAGSSSISSPLTVAGSWTLSAKLVSGTAQSVLLSDDTAEITTVIVNPASADAELSFLTLDTTSTSSVYSGTRVDVIQTSAGTANKFYIHVVDAFGNIRPASSSFDSTVPVLREAKRHLAKTETTDITVSSLVNTDTYSTDLFSTNGFEYTISANGDLYEIDLDITVTGTYLLTLASSTDQTVTLAIIRVAPGDLAVRSVVFQDTQNGYGQIDITAGDVCTIALVVNDQYGNRRSGDSVNGTADANALGGLLLFRRRSPANTSYPATISGYTVLSWTSYVTKPVESAVTFVPRVSVSSDGNPTGVLLYDVSTNVSGTYIFYLNAQSSLAASSRSLTITLVVSPAEVDSRTSRFVLGAGASAVAGELALSHFLLLDKFGNLNMKNPDALAKNISMQYFPIGTSACPPICADSSSGFIREATIQTTILQTQVLVQFRVYYRGNFTANTYLAIGNSKRVVSGGAGLVLERRNTSAPSVKSVNFDPVGSSVEVTFNISTNRGFLQIAESDQSVTVVDDCQKLLTPATYSLVGGVDASCYWRNRTTLVVNIAATSTIVPGSNFSIAPDMIYSAAINSFAVSSTPVVVALSPNKMTPLALFSAPSVVGSCADIVLDATMSVGGARALMFKWNSPDSVMVNAIKTYVGSLDFTSDAMIVRIPVSALGNNFGVFSVYLTVQNALGQASTTAIRQIRRVASSLPAVMIRGGDRSIKRSDELALELDIRTCSTMSITQPIAISWSVVSVPTGCAGVSILEEQRTQTKLVFGNYSLCPGAIVFKAQVTVMGLVASQSVTINVESSDLVAVIEGGNSRTLPLGASQVNLRSLSFDPDSSDASSITYSWSCLDNKAAIAFNADVFPCRDPQSLLPLAFSNAKVVPVVPNKDHRMYKTYVFPQSAEAIADYTIVLRVTKGSRTATTYQNIYFVNSSPPTVTIQPVTSSVVATSIFPLYGDSSAGSTATYQWSIPNSDAISLDDSLTETGLASRTLVMAPNTLTTTAGMEVVFRLNASLAGLTGFAEVSVKVNRPPTSGSCHLTPTTTASVGSLWTVSCLHYTDDSGKSPRYQVGVYNSDGYPYALTPFQQTSSVDIYLPSSNTVWVKILDNRGTFTREALTPTIASTATTASLEDLRAAMTSALNMKNIPLFVSSALSLSNLALEQGATEECDGVITSSIQLLGGLYLYRDYAQVAATSSEYLFRCALSRVSANPALLDNAVVLIGNVSRAASAYFGDDFIVQGILEAVGQLFNQYGRSTDSSSLTRRRLLDFSIAAINPMPVISSGSFLLASVTEQRNKLTTILSALGKNVAGSLICGMPSKSFNATNVEIALFKGCADNLVVMSSAVVSAPTFEASVEVPLSYSGNAQLMSTGSSVMLTVIGFNDLFVNEEAITTTSDIALLSLYSSSWIAITAPSNSSFLLRLPATRRESYAGIIYRWSSSQARWVHDSIVDIDDGGEVSGTVQGLMVSAMVPQEGYYAVLDVSIPPRTISVNPSAVPIGYKSNIMVGTRALKGKASVTSAQCRINGIVLSATASVETGMVTCVVGSLSPFVSAFQAALVEINIDDQGFETSQNASVLFSVYATPVVSLITPGLTPASAAYNVTITGQNLQFSYGGYLCRFGPAASGAIVAAAYVADVDGLVCEFPAQTCADLCSLSVSISVDAGANFYGGLTLQYYGAVSFSSPTPKSSRFYGHATVLLPAAFPTSFASLVQSSPRTNSTTVRLVRNDKQDATNTLSDVVATIQASSSGYNLQFITPYYLVPIPESGFRFDVMVSFNGQYYHNTTASVLYYADPSFVYIGPTASFAKNQALDLEVYGEFTNTGDTVTCRLLSALNEVKQVVVATETNFFTQGEQLDMIRCNFAGVDDGTYRVSLALNGQQYTSSEDSAADVTVGAPNLDIIMDSITPQSGRTDGATSVVLTGSFSSVPTDTAIYCLFGSLDAVSATLSTDQTTVSCKSPARALTGDVQVALYVLGYRFPGTNPIQFRYYQTESSFAVSPSVVDFNSTTDMTITAYADFYSTSDSMLARLTFASGLVLTYPVDPVSTTLTLPATYSASTGMVTFNVPKLPNSPQTFTVELAPNGVDFDSLATVVTVNVPVVLATVQVASMPSFISKFTALDAIRGAVPILQQDNLVPRALCLNVEDLACPCTKGAALHALNITYAILPASDSSLSATYLGSLIIDSLQPNGATPTYFGDGQIPIAPYVYQAAPYVQLFPTTTATDVASTLTILLSTPLSQFLHQYSDDTPSGSYWISSSFNADLVALVPSQGRTGDVAYYLDRSYVRVSEATNPLFRKQVTVFEAVFTRGYPGCFSDSAADVAKRIMNSYIQFGATTNKGFAILDAATGGSSLRQTAVTTFAVVSNSVAVSNLAVAVDSAGSLLGIQSSAFSFLPKTFDVTRIVQVAVSDRQGSNPAITDIAVTFAAGLSESVIPNAEDAADAFAASLTSSPEFITMTVVEVNGVAVVTATPEPTPIQSKEAHSDSNQVLVLAISIGAAVAVLVLVGVLAAVYYRRRTRTLRYAVREWSEVDIKHGPMLNDVIVA